MDNTNKNKNKDILNYASDYGKDLHEKTLMEETRKKEIKKYEKDHENNSKERINIYVDNLNIDKFDNSNYGNNINPTVQGNLDLNMDWSIKSSEPLYNNNNNGLQLPKSNNIKEEEIKNSKIYKDMENNYKEALKERNKEIEELRKGLIEANHKNKNLIKLKKILISIIDNFKNKMLTDETIDLIKIFIDEDVNDNE